jgi:hypothetical protein
MFTVITKAERSFGSFARLTAEEAIAKAQALLDLRGNGCGDRA